MPNLLKRDARAWQIHYTIIDEFMPKYTKETNNNYESQMGNTFNVEYERCYSVDYHIG
jgi:hypothetical protein